jgi:hypothetical protein
MRPVFVSENHDRLTISGEAIRTPRQAVYTTALTDHVSSHEKSPVRFGFESKQKAKSKDTITRKQTMSWPSIAKSQRVFPKIIGGSQLTAPDLEPVVLPPFPPMMHFRCGRCGRGAIAAGNTIEIFRVKICCDQEMTQIKRRGRPRKNAGWS